MQHPSENKNSREREKRQQADLLDQVEDLEARRRRLLVEVTESFITWGKTIGKSKKIIKEMKRLRLLRDTHEIEP